IYAMSQYNTITSIGESPFDENLLYVGTDDGLIQVSEDGGANWRRIEVGTLPGVPDTAFVNDIRADLHDGNTVYVALDNHKYGDYTPYLLKSTNRGRSWTSITGDIPERHLMWRIVQDHVNPNLLFTATEFGLYFTLDGGAKWVKLTGKAPTISFRDVTIQRREDDLVAASFGRGFFIVDDISALRTLSEASLAQEAMLFPGRKAWWYLEQHPLAFSAGGNQGHGYFRAPNPPFGANFTYYLADDIQSLTQARKEREKPLIKEGADTPFPSFEALTAELREEKPTIWLTVRDSDGNVVRRLKGPAKKGFHRVNWNLRYPPLDVARAPRRDGRAPSGFLAAPGDYTVDLTKRVRGVTTQLVAPMPFTVEPLRAEGALPRQPDAEAFATEIAAFDRSVTALGFTLREAQQKVKLLAVAARSAPRGDPATLDGRLDQIRAEVNALDELLNGNPARNAIYERTQPTVRSRLRRAMGALYGSTYGPTQTQRDQLAYAKADYDAVKNRLVGLTQSTIPAFEAELIALGAPYVPGGVIPEVQ
ncbi:MAG: glycosyl hydrolase, partial [Pseudomonadota bacterium]